MKKIVFGHDHGKEVVVGFSNNLMSSDSIEKTIPKEYYNGTSVAG